MDLLGCRLTLKLRSTVDRFFHVGAPRTVENGSYHDVTDHETDLFILYQNENGSLVDMSFSR